MNVVKLVFIQVYIQVKGIFTIILQIDIFFSIYLIKM